MSYSVIYSTHTDNAVKLASRIVTALGDQELVFDGRAAGCPDFALEADTVFVGFWTTGNSCDKLIQNLLAKLKGKRIAIFGTCGFGSDQEHFDLVRKNVLSFVDPSTTVAGFYLVNGRIGQGFVHQALESNGAEGEDFHYPNYRRFYQEDAGHPTAAELEACAAWAQQVYRA